MNNSLVYVSPAVERVLGYRADELVGDPAAVRATEVDPPPRAVFLEAAAAHIRDGSPSPWVDLRRRHRDGHIVTMRYTRFPIVEKGEQVGWLAIAHDVTAERETQRQLAQADRLAALGMLAAGVGHEINNPAAYILLGVKQVQRAVAQARGEADPRPMLDVITPLLDDVDQGIQRIVAIAGQLRMFARPSPATDVCPVDLNQILSSAASLVAGNEPVPAFVRV